MLAGSGRCLKLCWLTILLLFVDSRCELIPLAGSRLLFPLLLLVVGLIVDGAAIVPIIIAESIVSVDLLELRGQALLRLWRWKHLFKFLDGLSYFLFIAGVISQRYAEQATHIF